MSYWPSQNDKKKKKDDIVLEKYDDNDDEDAGDDIDWLNLPVKKPEGPRVNDFDEQPVGVKDIKVNNSYEKKPMVNESAFSSR